MDLRKDTATTVYYYYPFPSSLRIYGWKRILYFQDCDISSGVSSVVVSGETTIDGIDLQNYETLRDDFPP